MYRHVRELARSSGVSSAAHMGSPTTSNTRPRAPELLDRLTAASRGKVGEHGPVILLSAPAGAGKTVLVRQWIAHCGSTVSAWIDIGERDNSDTVLCASLRQAFAVGTRVPSAERDFHQMTWESAERCLETLIDAVAATEKQFVLVLDDVQNLHAPMALEILETLLTLSPPNLCIVALARHDPPISWHELTLSGRLSRFKPAELALSGNEIQAVMSEYALELSPEHLRIITDMTQGWAALVRLAAVYLSGHSDRDAAIVEFEHTPRAVSDYLVDEVLTSLSPESIIILLFTSCVESFSLDLAEVLVEGDACVGLELDSLQRLNIVADHVDAVSGERWYSCHRLLREHLRAEFRRVHPGDLSAVHRRAAAWYESRLLEFEALEHTLLAGDDDAVHTFLDRHGLGLILDGRGMELITLLEHQAASIAESSTVRLLHAAAVLSVGDLDAAAAYLDFVDAHGLLDADQSMLALALRVELARGVGSAEHHLLVAELAGTQAVRNPDILAYCHYQLGISRLVRGETDVAVGELSQAIAFAELRNRSRTVLAALGELALAAGAISDVKTMADSSAYALDYGDRHRLTTSLQYRRTAAISALIAYLQDDGDAVLAARLQVGADARESGLQASGRHTVIAYRLYALISEHDSRRSLVAEIRDAMSDAVAAGTRRMATAALLPTAVQACLWVGEADWADRLVHLASISFGDGPEVGLAHALVRFATGHVAEARVALEAAMRSRHDLLLANNVYLYVLEAVVAAAEDRPRDAQRAVCTALTCAESGKVLRPFLDLAASIRPVLDDFSGHFGEHEAFAQSLRARIGPAARTPPLLTRSEQLVLHELASGDTTDAIAERMFLSVNTIKTHLRGIYRKFEVSSRRDALRVARRHGFL